MQPTTGRAQGQPAAERSCYVHWQELPHRHIGDAPKNRIFLADIVEDQTILSTATYAIRDMSGRELLLAIYPMKPGGRSTIVTGTYGADGRMQLSVPPGPRAEKLRSMEAGTMVAVKNCAAHWFRDGNAGVRLDEENGDLDSLKHFPCTIAQFFELDKRRRAADEDSSATCVMCTKPNAAKRCKKCKTKYCSQECQLKHWDEGHKSECRILAAQREYDALLA